MTIIRKIPRLRVILLLILTNLFISSQANAWWMWTPGDTVDNSSQSVFAPGYKPTQPIPFSHKIHAGDRKIPCEYCHSSARRSASAGIPPLNNCMGCHKIVATDRENIKKIAEAYGKKETINWIKVHDLPDHVRFSHQPHVAGGVTCQECHGAVETMEVVEQWAPLQMGWCISCHNQKEVSTNCMTCHY